MKALIINSLALLCLSVSSKAQLNFEEFKMITHYHDEGSYVMHPRQGLSDGSFEFADGEGEEYILEAMIAGVYDIAHSNYWTPQAYSNTQWKFSIAGNVNFRLATPSDSLTSPSLPPSNKIGLRYDFGWVDSTIPLLGSRRINHIRADLFHYSNGMANLDSLNNRLNLRNSDFSTNYFRLSFGTSTIRSDSVIFKGRSIRANSYSSLAFFLQHDFGAGNTLAYLPDDGDYGHWRIGGNIHIPIYLRRRGAGSPRIGLFSFDLDYIVVVDSIESSNSQRHSVTAKFVVHPFGMPSGIMFFGHLGRDYMNIRYTIPGSVNIFGIGLSLQNI